VYFPDGKRILSVAADRTARIWDANSGKEIGLFKGHRSAAIACAVRPDGKQVATGGADGVVKLWDPDKRVEGIAKFQTYVQGVAEPARPQRLDWLGCVF